jgi:hypothetical protein
MLEEGVRIVFGRKGEEGKYHRYKQRHGLLLVS